VTSNSRLALSVCGEGPNGPAGAALSLWTWAQVRERCAAMGQPESVTCLAPLLALP
jgi:hypothetical protein